MGMKKIITRLVAVFLVAALTLPVAAAQNGKGPWNNPYSDVTENQWSYSYIAQLSQAGILPDSDKFRSTDQETRLEFVAALYAMHLSLGGKAAGSGSLPFTDVPADSADYAAVLWAYRLQKRLLPWGGREDPAVEELALKARFSQHTLTEAERKRAAEAVEAERDRVDAALPWWKRLAFRWLFALR